MPSVDLEILRLGPTMLNLRLYLPPFPRAGTGLYAFCEHNLSVNLGPGAIRVDRWQQNGEGPRDVLDRTRPLDVIPTQSITPGQQMRFEAHHDVALYGAVDQPAVVLYRASRDIHRQQHPEAFSLSINLLVKDPVPQRQDQYFFDLETGTVIGMGSAGSIPSRVLPCRLARYLGDGRTAEALEPIAAEHASPRVRVAALESLAALAGPAAASVWRRGEADPHPLVKHHARQALAELA